MDDRLLASRAAAGDLDSFGQLYDRYVNRVYDFAWRALRDPEGADAVTRGVFERASRELALAARSPSVAAWLLGMAHAATIARAESVGVVPVGPAPAAEEAFGTFDVPDPVQLVDTSAAAGDTELPGLVWEASASLGPRDYAMLDFDQRQHLDAGEIGFITGDGKAATQTIVARMRTVAGDVIGSYALARRGQDACPVLRTIVARYPMPPYTDEARREIQQHLAGCDACRITASNLPPLLPVFASLAVIAAPFALKGDLWRDIAAGWTRTAAFVGAAPDRRAVAAAGGGGFGAGSIGVLGVAPDGPDWTRNRILLFGGGALALVVFAFGIGALIAGAIGGGGDGNGGATSTRTATVEADGTPAGTPTLGVVVPTQTATVPATITPTPSITPTPAPTDTPTITPIPASPTRTPRPEPTPTVTRTPRPGRTTPTPEPIDTPVTP